jgi:hypothetical protein
MPSPAHLAMIVSAKTETKFGSENANSGPALRPHLNCFMPRILDGLKKLQASRGSFFYIFIQNIGFGGEATATTAPYHNLSNSLIMASGFDE